MSNPKEKSIDELLQNALIPKEEQPYKVPENWVWVKLGFVNNNIARSIEPSKFVDEIFELYSVPNYVLNEPEYLSGKEIGSNKQLVLPNEVLLCKINPRINRVWVVTANNFKYRQIASTEWIVFSENIGVYPIYLMYYLRTSYFRQLLASNVSGVGGSLTRARPKDVESYPLAMPPFQEQIRIVNRISSLFLKTDEASRFIEEAKETFELRRAAILDKAFHGELTRAWRENQKSYYTVEEFLEKINKFSTKNEKRNKKFIDQLDSSYKSKLYKIPDNWKWVKLDDLIESSVYGTSQKANDDITGIPVLRMGNITSDGGIVLESLKYISNECAEIDKLDLQTNDILFNRTNSYELVGKSALITEDIAGKAIFASYLIRIRLHEKNKLATYVCAFINSYFGRQMLLSMATQQVGQANINSQKLASIFIPLPSEKELSIITNYLKSFKERNDYIDSSVTVENNVNELKEAILQKAFRGELGTNNPTEESAVELLKATIQS